MLCILFYFSFEQKALRTGTSTRLDERVFAMCEFKTQPLQQLMRMIHPDLYRLDNMSDKVSPEQVPLVSVHPARSDAKKNLEVFSPENEGRCVEGLTCLEFYIYCSTCRL